MHWRNICKGCFQLGWGYQGACGWTAWSVPVSVQWLLLWISWFDMNRCLLFTKNSINEYTQYIGNIFKFLNRSLQESLVFAYIKTLINVYRLSVGKPEGKRPLGRPRHRWIDNIKMDLLEIWVSVVDWTGLAQNRYRWRALVNSVMNLQVP
jgi:hypothetical protein